MTQHFDDEKQAAPPLSDEAVVYLHDALSHYLMRFESRYFAQIQRYYQDRSEDRLLPSGIATQCKHAEDPF